jgi:tetratricopeptide (TPR) repeat protein
VRNSAFVMSVVLRSSLHLLRAVLVMSPALGCASAAPERTAVVDMSPKQIAAPEQVAAGSSTQLADPEADRDEPGIIAKILAADSDGDGLVDKSDKCPDIPEDHDGFEDKDGCPEMDNDADGIADAADKCPNAPETMNGLEDDDGCPDAAIDRAKVAFRDGATAFAQGDYAKARKHFEDAYKMEPRDPVLYNIAVCAEKLGDRKSACQTYRQWRATSHGAASPNSIPSLETCP